MSEVTPACTRPTKKYPAGRTGTTAGYMAHRKASESACHPCTVAQSAASVVRRGESPERYAAYRRALDDYRARIDAGDSVLACAKPSLDYLGGRTGLRAGYMAHYWAKEQPCDPCMEGNARQAAQDVIANPDLILRRNLGYHYKLTVERYREILSAQGGKCAICGIDSPTDVRTSRFHVDHDHACCPSDRTCGNCVRGLLCHACNTALGNFKDDPDVLLSAFNYLIRHGKETTS